MRDQAGLEAIVNLSCGHAEKRISLLHGKQVIKCIECGAPTIIEITINQEGFVSLFEVYPWEGTDDV